MLIFAKAPVPGQVKTRLAETLGEAEAAALHRRLTRRAVDTAIAARLGPVLLYCAPDTRHAFFRQLKKDTGVMLRTQRGLNLGQRMHHAMARELRSHPGVILIGCDCPRMDAGYLQRAAGKISAGESVVVLGPATDGGYVLIGASAVDERLFQDVPWGSEAVLEITRARLSALSWSWCELDPLSDIDRPEDLAGLEETLQR